MAPSRNKQSQFAEDQLIKAHESLPDCFCIQEHAVWILSPWGHPIRLTCICTNELQKQLLCLVEMKGLSLTKPRHGIRWKNSFQRFIVWSGDARLTKLALCQIWLRQAGKILMPSIARHHLFPEYSQMRYPLHCIAVHPASSALWMGRA